MPFTASSSRIQRANPNMNVRSTSELAESRSGPYLRTGERSPVLERQQRLRARRLLVSVCVYLPCSGLLALVAWLGHLPAWLVPVWATTFAATNLAFFALVKTDINLRFKDPSMTMAQMAVAIVAVAMVLYHADGARGSLLMFLLVILFFGVLQLKTTEVLVMGALCAFAYGAVIVLLTMNRPSEVNAKLEWVQWIALTATLAVLCPFIGYLSNIRRRLGESLRTIKELAQRDALTGLFNRHHLDDTLTREIARCSRGASAFLLVMVDVDHFKRINDAHGHLVGDCVLQAVAQRLQGALRKGDYLARFGGEEFVLMMAVDGPHAALATCDRLRKSVEELKLDELGSQHVTVSLGGSFYRPQDTPASLLERADAALYRAKSSGRNRTELET